MRPSKEQYMLQMAQTVANRADCMGRKVGAVIHRDSYVVATGYNGTPQGMTNCTDGGCFRCANREEFGLGVGYHLCICVHAEMNALLTAARWGARVEGASIVSTLRPCVDCLKSIVQAGITVVHFQTTGIGYMSKDYVRLVSHLKEFLAINPE